MKRNTAEHIQVIEGFIIDLHRLTEETEFGLNDKLFQVNTAYLLREALIALDMEVHVSATEWDASDINSNVEYMPKLEALQAQYQELFKDLQAKAKHGLGPMYRHYSNAQLREMMLASKI